LKISAISNLKNDIIFLSDIRMGEINNQSSTHRIQTAFLKTNLRGYDWYFHSTKNSRGVGMLIKKHLV
jgi:hypothetical protein